MASYSRLPGTSEPEEAHEPHSKAERVKAEAIHVAERAKDAASRLEKGLERGLSRGLAGASRASHAIAAGMTAPAGTDVEGLLGAADLPAFADADPVSSLAHRLDREADLWRNLALRELARLAWVDRIAQWVAIVAIVGDVGLGVVAAIAAIFGSEHAAGSTLLLGVAAAALTVGAVVVAFITMPIRRMQKAVANEALVRADLAELRLHRVAIVLAWKNQEPAVYQEALARLERDASGS